MKFVFESSPALKTGTAYSGKITSVTFIDLDKETERVLVNVLVEGFAQPSPASYSTTSATGARMFSDLLLGLGAKKKDTASPEKIEAFLKGKVVVVRIKDNGEYKNTSLSLPKAETAEEGNGATI